MSTTTNNEKPVESVLADRRRPGRTESVSPELVGLLRAAELQQTIAESEAMVDDDDQLSPMRGVIWGVGLSIPAWVGIAAMGRWLLN